MQTGYVIQSFSRMVWRTGCNSLLPRHSLHPSRMRVGQVFWSGKYAICLPFGFVWTISPKSWPLVLCCTFAVGKIYGNLTSIIINMYFQHFGAIVEFFRLGYLRPLLNQAIQISFCLLILLYCILKSMSNTGILLILHQMVKQHQPFPHHPSHMKPL